MNESEASPEPDDARPRLAIEHLVPALVQLAALRADPNVTRAAARSHVSQPTLSRAMVRWERDLGIALFERAGREISLTDDGVALAQAASLALAALERAAGELLGVQQPRVLGVGVLRSLGPTIVGELVSSFHAKEPGVRVSHREGASDELLAELDGGHLDFAVLAPRPGAHFGWLRLGSQTLSLVVPIHHRLAGLDDVDLADTAEESYLALNVRYATRQQADRLCADAGFSPKFLLEAEDAQTVRDYVAVGLGIAILPTDTSEDPRVRNIPIRSLDAAREFGMTWDTRRRLSPVAAAFFEHAEELGSRYPGWADLLDS
ncbi:LysR family transcriptional regulator [Pengzhenrongella sp.]|jgi:DNA-binding transcriptional LysR family regulator|uniref:LysR family transcriptional regulator n=1 Tax=Pengzhenrongella sp. TaxID=2888820 RepID=UPI002F929431